MKKWLTNLSIYKQLIIPVLIVSIVGISAAMYFAHILDESIAALDRIHKEGDKRVSALENIEASIILFRAQSLEHLVNENAVSMRELQVKLKQSRQTIEHQLQFVLTSYRDVHAEVMLRTRDFSNLLNDYFAKTDQIIKLSTDFEKEYAFELMASVESDFYKKINTQIKELKHHEAMDLASSRNNLASVVRQNLSMTIAIGVFGGSLLVLIIFIVARRITRRLSVLLYWSKDVSSGNWSRPLVSTSLDEVGQLTQEMENMRQNIQRAHGELAQAKLEAEHVADTLQLYANAFENSGESILISDKQNNIINVNQAFTRETGFSRVDVIGKNPKILASGKTPDSTFEEMWAALNKYGFWQGEMWDRKKSGEIYPKWAAISAIKDNNNNTLFYIASFTDISERKEAEARIQHLAHHDILTDLQNRFSLEDRLEQSLYIASRDHTLVAVLFLDLDHFKHINDSLGHHVGDQLLIHVAGRLKECVRESDIVARIGGDEFVIALTGLTDSNQVAVIVEKILRRISTPYQIEANQLETTPSIGVSFYPNDGATADELMRNADIAMYHAKEQGRNNYYFFTETMLIAAQDRLKFESELQAALENGQLALHYQPQVHVAEQCVFAVEALVRWKHPEKGDISPVKFIPLAEETGLIHELGAWVLNEACRQLTAWKETGIQDIVMSVNLSAIQLHSPGLTEVIGKILKKHGVNGSELELEITETAAMTDPDQAVQQLNALRELGIGLAIDDFGTGYSSLAYLKRLPIQTLKLDRTFVRDIETDQNDAEISAATIDLAHNLGLKVVAEGVETEGQRDFLMQNDCDYLQGYLFSKPLPADEATSYLRDRIFCNLRTGNWGGNKATS